MAFYGKMYKLERTENFEDYVKSLNLSAEQSQTILKSKTTQKLEKEGDEFVITSYYDGRPSEMRFKSGVEFDEMLHPAVVPKSTITVEGNKFTQVQKYKDGNTITYVREYSPDQLVVTVTTNFWSGKAKAFYVVQ